MDLKINLNTDEQLNEDTIIININASKNCNQLHKFINHIQQFENKKENIIGFIDNELYIIPIDSILYFYTENQKCYCKTDNKNYIIKKRLYELDDFLNSEQFIRISNSCIINIKKIECFDLNRTGNISVKFTNGDSKDVSKRRVSYITKFLKERW